MAVLFALPLALFWSVTFGGFTLLPADNLFQYEPFRADAAALGVGRPQNHLLSDLVLENYPWKRFILGSLAHGELPLWNPYLFAGVPFLAAGQHGALYPLSVLYYALPLANAYGWFTVINLGLAGVFMFVLVRGYGLSRGAATLAGAAYQLSGFLITSVVFQMMIAAAAWLPLILALCDKIIFQAAGLRGRNTSAQWALLGALAIACQIFAGHVEITIYTALVAAAYCAHRLFWSGLRGSRNVWRPAAWLVLMALLGAALGALQVIPLYELVNTSFRSARADFAQVLGYGFPKSLGWMRWLVPNFFGSEAQHTFFNWFSLQSEAAPTPSGYTFWGNAARWKQSVEGGAYVGILTLALALVAGVNFFSSALKRTRAAADSQHPTCQSTAPVGFYLVLALFSVAFVFGTPLYALLYYGLPGINQLHSPFRWVFPLTIALVVLAAVGFDALRAMPRRARSAIVLPAACISAGLGIVVVLMGLRLAWSSVEPLVLRVLDALELSSAGFTPRFFYSYEAANFLHFALALIAAGACMRWLGSARAQAFRQRRWFASAGAAILPIAIVALDCVAAWRGFNPAVDPRLLGHVPAPVQFLLQDKTPWRFTTFDDGGKPLNANSGWLFNLQDIRGYDSIIPKRYVEYMQLVEKQDELPFNRIAPLRTRTGLESPLLDLLNVKYILTERAIDPPIQGLAKAYDDGHTLIYRNERVLPRAFVMPLSSGLLTNDFGASVQRSDPRRFVMIDASCGVTDIGCVIPQAADYKPATITSYTNNEVWVDVALSESGWLMLTDSYFEGWHAYIRPTGGSTAAEREVAILPANGNFRAVRIDLPGAANTESNQGSSPLVPPSTLLKPPAAAPVAQTAAQSAGLFTVRFKYSPDSVRSGAFISALAGVLLVFCGGVIMWRVLRLGARESTATDHQVRRVARNSLALTALNMLARVIDMAFALVMLRFLGPAGNGNFTFAIVIVSWFEILMNFGLNTFLVRDASRDRAHAATYFYKTTALRLMLALVAAPLVGVVILLYSWLDGITPDTRWAIALLVLSQLPGSLATGLSALFYSHEKAEVPAALTIISALVKAVLGAAALTAGWGIVGLAIVSIITNTLTMSLLFALARRILNLAFTSSDLKLAFARTSVPPSSVPSSSSRQILGEAFPLMINHLLSTIFFKVDVPLLRAFTRDAAQVGFYSVGYKYVDALNIIPSLFTQSLFPAMSRMAAQAAPGDAQSPIARSYVLAAKLLLMVALPLSVAISFLATPLIGLLGGSAFLPQGALALAIVIWHMPLGWINSITNYALIAAGQQRALTRAFVGAVVFNILANLIAIPAYGYMGAAVVTVLSEGVQLATFYFYVRRFIVKVAWLSVLPKPFLGAGLMAGILFFAAQAGLLLMGLLAGSVVYLAVVFGLRALTLDERKVLRPLLPARLRSV